MIKEFLSKYKNYLAAGCLLVVLFVAVGAANGQAADVPMSELDLSSDTQEESFEIDAHDEINTLITNYFEAYTSGDIEALSKYVSALTETEKSYISVYSQFVDGCENIVCYTKSGLDEGEYIVSVYLELVFHDVETRAPGLDFFYVKTDENGRLYIDNTYSQFNQSNQEENADPEVEALIAEFENSEDMEKLKSEVQTRYEKALSSDAALRAMIEETMPDAIAEWAGELARIAKEQNAANSVDAQTAESTGTDKSENGETDPDGEEQQNTGEPENNEEADEEIAAQDGAEDVPDGNTDMGESAEETQDQSDTAADDTAETTGTKMYTITDIKLRRRPDTDAKVLTVIKKGKKLTAYIDTLDDNGWVRVTYDGQEGYVKREYLVRKKSSIPKDETETSTNDTTSVIALPEGKEITLSGNVNLRKTMSEDGEKMATVSAGETVKVVMSYAEGWTKVEWKEKVGYMRTDLIK